MILMRKPYAHTPTSGFSIVEMSVAFAIFITVVTAAASAFQIHLKLHNSNSIKTRAALIIDEGFEAMKILRDISWKSNMADLENETDYYLFWNGTTYATSTTVTEFSNDLVFRFRVSYVHRDSSSGNIVSTGGYHDTGTLKITYTVAPLSDSSKTILATDVLIHDIFNN